jgi:hypothetical protein
MEPETAIINVKDAVKRAIVYFQDLMQSQISDIWLEEVELSADEEWWVITLSALAPARKEANDALTVILAKSERLYRTFKVDSHTGQVRSMKIHTLQSQ